MLGQHLYVHLGENGKRQQYLSFRENPLLLVWLLYWYGKPLGYRWRGFRSTLGGCKFLARVVLKLFYYRLFSPTAADVLKLPVLGQLCIRVRNGYKVFDFRRNIVAKVFEADIDQAKVLREIAWAQRVGAHGFAPTVRRWNIKGRWYEEDYVNGYPMATSNWADFLQKSRESLIPLLADMIVVAPHREVRSIEYACKQSELIQRKLTDERIDKQNVTATKNFINAIVDRLRLLGDRPISLVCSHGDFSPIHVLTTDHSTVIIDWEKTGYRSALFDLYHVFFRRIRNEHMAAAVAAVMDQAVSQLKFRLVLHPSDNLGSPIESLDVPEVYRLIYYIECLCLCVEKSKRMAKVPMYKISRFIEAYTQYEDRHVDDNGQTYLFEARQHV